VAPQITVLPLRKVRKGKESSDVMAVSSMEIHCVLKLEKKISWPKVSSINVRTNKFSIARCTSFTVNSNKICGRNPALEGNTVGQWISI